MRSCVIALSVIFIAGGCFAALVAFPRLGAADPDKLGWMDDAPLTDADRARIAEITGRGEGDDVAVIRSIQAGDRSSLTRRDFELLRQDRRRAQAAYPDVKPDDLLSGAWFAVDLADRVPDSFCSSGNSDSTQGADGKWYLDGRCYLSVVRAAYRKRADAATTKRVLAELRDGTRQRRLAHLRRWGYDTWWGGTGGSASVHCYPDPLPSDQEADDRHVAGQCVVVLDEKIKYVFPFVATDWLSPPFDKAGLAKLAESKGALAADYTAPAAKPWTVKDGLLARGQTCPPGRLCWSSFNWDKDDYDNKGREARCTQSPPLRAEALADRALPIKPASAPLPNDCVQGGTIMPGQSCIIR